MRRFNQRLQLQPLERRDNPAPAQVSGIVINSGAAQRSIVKTLRVDFNQPVTIANVNQAFTLTRVSDNAAVTLNTVLDASGTFASITFTGGAVQGTSGNRSLQDGRYVLTAVAGQFTGEGLDGNGDGVAGDNYQSPSSANPWISPPTGIFALYGDVDGNGQVNGFDHLSFIFAITTGQQQYIDLFDIDGNGLDGTDALQYRLHFLKAIT
jgi:hypothetical protein